MQPHKTDLRSSYGEKEFKLKKQEYFGIWNIKIVATEKAVHRRQSARKELST